MDSFSSTNETTIRRAQPGDAKDMVPVFFRSFHPVSPYMVRAFPQTPVIEAWWESVHNYSITSPDVSVHVVTHGEEIVALGRWRFCSSTWVTEEVKIRPEPSFEHTGDLSAGTWSLIPLSPDHDEELCKSMTDFSALHRKSYMSGHPHVLLEFLLCVQEYKGIGAGKLLVEQCIREADEKGLDIFVEANGAVVKFYEKHGFKEKDRVVMPGGYGYEEIILLRPTANSTEK